MLFEVVRADGELSRLFDRHEHIPVYDVSYDRNGYPQFLIYANGQWLRKSAKHFRPPRLPLVDKLGLYEV